MDTMGQVIIVRLKGTLPPWDGGGDGPVGTCLPHSHEDLKTAPMETGDMSVHACTPVPGCRQMDGSLYPAPDSLASQTTQNCEFQLQ